MEAPGHVPSVPSLKSGTERNGLYDQIIIISGKKMKYLFNLLSSYCAAWGLPYFPKNKNELVQN